MIKYRKLIQSLKIPELYRVLLRRVRELLPGEHEAVRGVAPGIEVHQDDFVLPRSDHVHSELGQRKLVSDVF